MIAPSKLTETEARVLATVAALGPITRREVAEVGEDARLLLPASYGKACAAVTWLVEYGHVEVAERVRGGRGPAIVERLRVTTAGLGELHAWRERWGRFDVRAHLERR